jgi:hypothetical protein
MRQKTEPITTPAATIPILGTMEVVVEWDFNADGTRCTLYTGAEAIMLWDRRRGHPLSGLPRRVDALPAEMEAAIPRDGAARPVDIQWLVTKNGAGVLTEGAARAGLAAYSAPGYILRRPLPPAKPAPRDTAALGPTPAQIATLTNLAKASARDFAKAFHTTFNPAGIKPARRSRIRDLVLHRLQDSARWTYRRLAQEYDLSAMTIARDLDLFKQYTGFDLAPPKIRKKDSLAHEARTREQADIRKATSADFRADEEDEEML